MKATDLELLAKKFPLSDATRRRNQAGGQASGSVPEQLEEYDPIGALWELYKKHGSVHRVASFIGTTGETVRKKLIKAGFRLNGSRWTECEIEALRDYYQMTLPEIFSLEVLAVQLKRTFPAVAVMASKLGITSKRTDPKNFSDFHRASISVAQSKRASDPVNRAMLATILKNWRNENPHPKGMLGKHHSKEACAAISEANKGVPVPAERTLRQMKTRLKRYGAHGGRRKTTWKQGWRDIGGKRVYFRSRWEANYARLLEFQKRNGMIESWDHEPKTFWFESVRRGCRSYLPDFQVVHTGGTVEFHEVKGWMDPRSITKLKRMKKYHPLVVLIIKDSAWFKENSRKLKNLIPGWE